MKKFYLDSHGTTASFDSIPGLDGIRAISIVIVMLHHSELRIPGVLGVTIFFFLSGFLITSLLLGEYNQKGTIDLASFYLRRFLRLYPSLLVYIAIVLIVLIVLQKPVDMLGLMAVLFYFANYLYATLQVDHIQAYGVQLWSLSLEEHFYIGFPPILLLLLNKRAAVLPMLAVVCLLPLAFRFLIVATTDPAFWIQYTTAATEARFDSILFGCVTAVTIRRPWGPRFIRFATHYATAGFALILLLGVERIPNPVFHQTLRFTLQNVALISLLLTAVYMPTFLPIKRLMNHPVTLWIAALSYSLYVWHLAVFQAAHYVLGSAPPALIYGTGWVASFVVAYAVHIAVERPIARLRRRFGSRAHENSVEQAPSTSIQIHDIR